LSENSSVNLSTSFSARFTCSKSEDEGKWAVGAGELAFSARFASTTARKIAVYVRLICGRGEGGRGGGRRKRGSCGQNKIGLFTDWAPWLRMRRVCGVVGVGEGVGVQSGSGKRGCECSPAPIPRLDLFFSFLDSRPLCA
jgi:hypothetical protein